LYQDHVITDREKQVILAKDVPFEKNEKLLSVISRKGLNKLRRFLFAIGQTHLSLYADLLQKIVRICPSAVDHLQESAGNHE
jgi:hypothetical protein